MLFSLKYCSLFSVCMFVGSTNIFCIDTVHEGVAKTTVMHQLSLCTVSVIHNIDKTFRELIHRSLFDYHQQNLLTASTSDSCAARDQHPQYPAA